METWKLTATGVQIGFDRPSAEESKLRWTESGINGDPRAW